MNTYTIIAEREDGTQVIESITERNEAAARKSFRETYRSTKGLKITDVNITAEGGLASKQQERETLEVIEKLVKELGPDSYLATAFAGCFDLAEWNIENDGGDSYKERAELAQERAKQYADKADEYKAQLERLGARIATLEAENEALKHPAPRTEDPVEISSQLLDDVAAFTGTYVHEVRVAVLENIATIAKDATLASLLREYASRKQAEAEEYRRDLENAVRYGREFRPSNNCLTHASSYRDVIYDLLRPYWEKGAQS